MSEAVTIDTIKNILTKNVNKEYSLSREEAIAIMNLPEDDMPLLMEMAGSLRKKYKGNHVSIHLLTNARSGNCSQNCAYCAQSCRSKAEIEKYKWVNDEKLYSDNAFVHDNHLSRHCIGLSGMKFTDEEIEELAEKIRVMKAQGTHLCCSIGFLTEKQALMLKEAGLDRINHNLNSSRSYYHNICTTHTYEDKIAAIRAAWKAGLEVCSGGIMGLGETVEDRIDLALEVRKLGVKSMPVNLLNPIPGTPYEHNPVLTTEEMRRIVAVFRFLLPDAWIRLAGGRGLLPDKGRSCFTSGANAAISGDMLTTAGITIERDMQMLGELGYIVE